MRAVTVRAAMMVAAHERPTVSKAEARGVFLSRAYHGTLRKGVCVSVSVCVCVCERERERERDRDRDRERHRKR